MPNLCHNILPVFFSVLMGNMAVNAADDCNMESETAEEEMTLWQRLFTYSYTEAVEQIENQKSNYSRYRVSNHHWGLVRSRKEAQGFSRDSYEHWIKIKRGRQSTLFHGEEKSKESSVSQSESSYLVLLEGILSEPKTIQVAANLAEPAQAMKAVS